MNGLAQSPKKAEVAIIGNTKACYEIYGAGKPLFLLHGFTQSSKSWMPFVADYADEYEVYVVDLKGHGRSGMFTETISIRSAAEEPGMLTKTSLTSSAVQRISSRTNGAVSPSP